MSDTITKPGRILVVEDEPTYRDAVASILKRAGYDVATAVNGKEALQRLPLWQPDLVVLDVSMPEFDGFEVCTAMKDDPAHRDVTVIFMSAHDDTASVTCAFDLGAADYITKPPQRAELLARVRAHLGMRQSRLAEQENAQREREAAVRELRHWQNDVRTLMCDALEIRSRAESAEHHSNVAALSLGLVDKLSHLSDHITGFLNGMGQTTGPYCCVRHSTSSAEVETILSVCYVKALQRGVTLNLRKPVAGGQIAIAPDVVRRILDECIAAYLDRLRGRWQGHVQIRNLANERIVVEVIATPDGEPQELTRWQLSAPSLAFIDQWGATVICTPSTSGGLKMTITFPALQ